MSALAALSVFLAIVSGDAESPSTAVASTQSSPQIEAADPEDFAARSIVLNNGVRGRIISFKSRNPYHFREWFKGDHGAVSELTGQLFVPPGNTKRPLIVVVPGSGNIGPHHLEQARSLVDEGFATFVIDPFRGRGIHSTAADQGQLSWAASVHDVFSAIDAVAGDPGIDPNRIGLLGSSRGGFAVISAMMAQVASHNGGKGYTIGAAFAGYPWCGLQFWRPRLLPGTSLEILAGNRDDWVSVQQCQDLVHALAQDGGSARIKLLDGAGHAFDRAGLPPTRLPDISRTSSYPTVYMDDDGNFMDPGTGAIDPEMTADFFLKQVVTGGFIEHGVTIGSRAGEAETYMAEMLRFFRRELGDTL
ncbi:dienelactone hydrolase family protein [Sphingopyxis sp.]|uniref:dienelactone hydrolase family protein n=1 Tax=Sphingopyxis sp. TaxID=1908224 RepID=UPI0025CFA3D5|nr:dienelactone hydrolase family protein [Sphingopyxis sp.]MBK6411615.1 dienelactone hydrolase family protein [Sphingopyxis sp.]